MATCARVCVRVYMRACTSECSRGQIHARAYKQTWGVVLAVPGRVRCRAMHVEVYEEVPRVIKFTGSVLHRVARVALCVRWIRRGGSERGSTNSVSGGQWLLW